MILGGTSLAIAGSIVWGWRFGLSRSDSNQTAVVSAVVALAAFALVAAGTIVAVITYMKTTGAPDLRPEITFTFSDPNLPVFSLDDAPEQTNQPKLAPWKQVWGKVYLHNRSAYAARHPGFRIDFIGLGGFDTNLNPGWKPLSVSNMVGVTSIQWDGGADYLVHGRWTRPLPDLNFAGVFVLVANSETALELTIAADGFLPKRSRIPVKCLSQAEYAQYTDNRLQAFLKER